MNRRDAIRLATLAALAPAGLTSTAAPGADRKKGMGTGIHHAGWSERLSALKCKWFYSWTPKIPERIPEGTEYFPMIPSYGGDKDVVARAGASAKAAGIGEFNEPDQLRQANMTVEQALDAWPLLQESGLRLGSPACAHADRDWMKAFMAGVKKRGLRVDFVCVHNYGGPDAVHFLSHLSNVQRLFRKPLWITEFAVGDWQAKTPEQNRHKPETVLKFMENVLPRLQRMDFIERYAWFPAARTSAPLGTSALFNDDSTLTRLGARYRDLA
jgi:Glycosyl hydrolase catalytic core